MSEKNVSQFPDIKRPLELQAFLDLFVISQKNDHFQSFEILGGDLREVQELAKTFEAHIVHVRPENN